MRFRWESSLFLRCCAFFRKLSCSFTPTSHHRKLCNLRLGRILGDGSGKWFLSVCWFRRQAQSGCYGGAMWKKVPRTANAPLQKNQRCAAWEFYFLFLFLFSQAPPIKSAPAEAENPAVSASERLLWLHGPNLISPVFFSSIICAARVYGGAIIEFSFCLLHYGSMQSVSSCLPPLLLLPLCYPSAADTRSISVAFQTDVAGNKIHPFFSFPHQLLHSSFLSFPSFLSLISVEPALSRTLLLPAVHAGNLFTVDSWRLKTPLCDTELICLNPHNNQAAFA